jgi:hypothetical protein
MEIARIKQKKNLMESKMASQDAQMAAQTAALAEMQALLEASQLLLDVPSVLTIEKGQMPCPISLPGLSGIATQNRCRHASSVKLQENGTLNTPGRKLEVLNLLGAPQRTQGSLIICSKF